MEPVRDAAEVDRSASAGRGDGL